MLQGLFCNDFGQDGMFWRGCEYSPGGCPSTVLLLSQKTNMGNTGRTVLGHYPRAPNPSEFEERRLSRSK